MAIRIILADDHPIMLSGARSLLERDDQYRVVAQASSPEELMKILSCVNCDVLVTDLNMSSPGTADGLHMIQSVQRRWPTVPIVVLTHQSGGPVIQALLQCDVRSIVHKEDALSELPVAVAETLRGGRYRSSHFKAMLEGEDALPYTIPKLTEREADVLRLFANGKTVKDIADIMNRSVKTVSGHKVSAMIKLGLGSDRDLYEYARNHHIVA